jgi:hypothetical protein
MPLIPPPKVASRAETTKCCVSALISQSLYFLFYYLPGCRNACSSRGIADAEYFAIVTTESLPETPTPLSINAMPAGLPRAHETACAARWTHAAAMV